MAAPVGLSTTNSTGVDFVYNNRQAGGESSIAGNTNSVIAIPNVQMLDFKNAQETAARQPGGVAFRGASNATYAAASNANASTILLDGMETYASRLGYAKNGAFIVALSGTTNSTVPLTNTQTNTNSFAGDTAFATVNQICVYNLSGLDGNNGASMNIVTGNTNGVSLGFVSGTNGVFNGVTLQAKSRIVIEAFNGITVNAANAALIFTPTANSTVGVVISGA